MFKESGWSVNLAIESVVKFLEKQRQGKGLKFN